MVFVRENPIYKWMTGATPMTQETFISWDIELKTEHWNRMFRCFFLGCGYHGIYWYTSLESPIPLASSNVASWKILQRNGALELAKSLNEKSGIFQPCLMRPESNQVFWANSIADHPDVFLIPSDYWWNPHIFVDSCLVVYTQKQHQRVSTYEPRTRLEWCAHVDGHQSTVIGMTTWPSKRILGFGLWSMCQRWIWGFN